MYKFFDFQLDSAHGLTRAGAPVALEPQALQLLEFLVSRRDEIVSKQDIIDEIWNGNAITDAALNTRIRSVRKALGDTAATSRFIKTYPKRGFQFVAPVSMVEPLEQAKPKISRRWPLATILAATGVLSVWILLTGDGPDTMDVGRPSIAVTRFNDLSEGASARYFADGLTDDLTAHLSRNRELFVVSSATVFSYVEEPATPLEIARDLGVEYVVRGSIRRAGDKVRVSGELVEVRANETVWAETFERELIDIFEVQDEISQAIAGRLLPEIYQADVTEVLGKPTDDLGACGTFIFGAVPGNPYFHVRPRSMRHSLRKTRLHGTRILPQLTV